jgi:hypothetical protein
LLCSLPASARAQSVFISEGDPQVSLDDVLGNASGIAVDADDHVFVADPINNVIRMYLPDGSPAAVIGQIGRAGRVDGTAAQARFSLPGRLCYDGAGGILVLDNSTHVRRVDVATLTVSTLVNLANGVDGTRMYDVTLGTYQDSGTLNNLRVGNLAVRTPGVIFVSAANSLGVTQYLLRCAGGAVRAIATSRSPVASSASAGTRGLTVDRSGNVFMPFPVLQPNGSTAEFIFRFAGGGVTAVTKHHSPLGKVIAMSAGRGDLLYYFTPLFADFQIISASTPNTSLGTLTVSKTYPHCSLSQLATDLAVTLGGDLLVSNSRSYDASCNSTSPFGKIDRFAGFDTPIGAAAGDTEPPCIELTAPAAGLTLSAATPLTATASDNVGVAQVQFHVNDRDYGPLLTSAPFSVSLNPATLPAGNLVLYAVARDAAGNAATSGRRLVRNRAGCPNFDGEVFAGDAALAQPVGIAVDLTGDVFVADQTLIRRFSPLGELEQTYGTADSGVVDGDAAAVRFGGLRGLGTDSSGRILAMDDSESAGCCVRQLDPATGLTTTLYQIDSRIEFPSGTYFNAIDGSLYDYANGIQTGWQDGRDVTGAPGGDILLTTGNELGSGWDPVFPYHYLVRLGPGGNRVLGLSFHSIFPDPYPRAVAVAADGTVFATLQTDPIYNKDSLYAFSPQFPTGGLGALQRVFAPLPEVDHLAADAAKRVYVPCAAAGSNPARVVVVSGVRADTPLFMLQHHLLNQPQDLAVDAEGNLYVVSSELRFWAGQFRPVANVVRYPAVTRAAPENAALPRTIGLAPMPPGAGFALGFDATPGATYEIEASETLPDGFRLVGTVVAAGDRVIWCDTGFGTGSPPMCVPRRFYRIHALQPNVPPP